MEVRTGIASSPDAWLNSVSIVVIELALHCLFLPILQPIHSYWVFSH
ncbi:MAG: hypothetical protein U9N41_00255 [Euryarchaeota archaeon]|nr:hypothetical protein [Euryarchaeota archaeon]